MIDGQRACPGIETDLKLRTCQCKCIDESSHMEQARSKGSSLADSGPENIKLCFDVESLVDIHVRTMDLQGTGGREIEWRNESC